MKKIQKRFILITMFSSLVVVILLIGAINIINLYSMNKKLTSQLNALEKNIENSDLKGEKKQERLHDMKKEKEEHEKQLRYFTVLLDAQDEIKKTDTSMINEADKIQPKKMVLEVLEHGKTSGYYQNYKYSVTRYEDGKRIIFLYCQSELAMVKEMFLISIGVSALMLLLMFLLVVGLSKKAITPLLESSEKQKRFITDAGHEIKTPLGIISANADVLELMHGKNEWTNSIHNQVERLDVLVKNLLLLSKTQEMEHRDFFEEFNLSQVIEDGAKSFCPVAKAKEILYELDIESNLMFYADKAQIEQLLSILVDNAMKYVTDGGEIKVILHKNKHKKQVYLEVYNTTQRIETKELNHLFERFYRSDLSRSRQSGGYGIGLSIAKSIVELHKGTIIAKSKDQTSISFCATFPITRKKS